MTVEPWRRHEWDKATKTHVLGEPLPGVWLATYGDVECGASCPLEAAELACWHAQSENK